MLLIMVLGVFGSAGLVLAALKKNINVYYTPSQLAAITQPKANLRLGGLVKKGSFHRLPQGLKLEFIITDLKREILVKYNGIVPSLFREGQGVVVDGQLIGPNIFFSKTSFGKA